LSRQSGQQRQIYASSSNENTYTDLWTDRFFGFRYWTRTVDNTGSPRRIKPVNLYYHMYSGEKMASLGAVLNNLAHVRKLEVTPVTTSHYAGIAEGFFSTQLTEIAPGVWTACSRDLLDTLRFDDATTCVDYARSRGVLGERRDLGSLYVALDPAVAEAVIATRKGGCPATEISLVHSRWPIRRLERTATGFRFHASGFGQGQMQWRVPPDRRWKVVVNGPATNETLTASSTAQGMLMFRVRASSLNQVSIEVTVSP
jgi:hypothetical protein